MEIQEGVFEPPDIPEEGVLVEGPDIGARHVGSEMSYQGIGEEKGYDGVEPDDYKYLSPEW